MDTEFRDESADKDASIQKLQEEIKEKTDHMIDLNDSNDQLTSQVAKLQ